MSAAAVLAGGLHLPRNAYVVVTSTCASGGRYIRTFAGPDAAIEAARFAHTEEGYGGTVTLRVST